MSSSGNDNPQSTTMILSSYSKAVIFIPICSNPPSGMILSFEECSFCFKSFPPSLFFPLFFTFTVSADALLVFFSALTFFSAFPPFSSFSTASSVFFFLAVVFFRAGLRAGFFSATAFSIVSVISLRFSSAVRFSVIFSCFFKIPIPFLNLLIFNICIVN